MLRQVVLTIALATAVAACTAARTPSADLALRDAFISGIQPADVGGVVNLASTVGREWSRVAFLGAYSSNEDAHQLLGFDFDVERMSPWNSNEGGTVVVFSRDGALLGWFPLPSDTVNVDCLDGRALAASAADVQMIMSQFDERLLIQAGSTACR